MANIRFMIAVAKIRFWAFYRRIQVLLSGSKIAPTPKGEALIRYCQRLVQTGGHIDNKTFADQMCEEHIRSFFGSEEDVDMQVAAYLVQQYYTALVPAYRTAMQ